jgi:hypothetical protein
VEGTLAKETRVKETLVKRTRMASLRAPRFASATVECARVTIGPQVRDLLARAHSGTFLRTGRIDTIERGIKRHLRPAWERSEEVLQSHFFTRARASISGA